MRTALSAVLLVAVAAIVLYRSYQPREEWSESYPLAEIIPAEGRASLDGAPCEELCVTPESRDRPVTVRYCGIAKRSLERYIVCEMGLRQPDPSFVGGEPVQALPFPDGLDPDARGAIDMKWCPEAQCAKLYAGISYMPDKFEVTGCKVAEPEAVVDAEAEYLVCSYTMRFGYLEAFESIAR